MLPFQQLFPCAIRLGSLSQPFVLIHCSIWRSSEEKYGLFITISVENTMLLQELVGRGSTDGTFRRQRFFVTEEDSGMFVAINRVRACEDPRQFLDYDPVYTPEPDTLLNDPKPLQQKEDADKTPLGVGERVVWMSDYGPEHGVVRWVGFLHDTREREWTVGVEFVSKIYIH